MMVPRRRGATNTTLAATQRHPCRSGMVTADCARSRSRPETWWRLAALKDHQNLAEFTISLTHSRARGADDRGRRRRNASYGVARDSHPVSTTAVRGLLRHRSLSGGRARGQRRAYEIDLRGARPACGAVCGNGRWLAADVDGLLVPIGWRRGFGAAPAMMVPRRRGATNTTLAATQRHPCRSGMVTADCARSRSRPETWWRLAALKDHQNLAEFTISLTHSRARGADDRGRRRRNASYGVARDSHPVSTTAVRGLLRHRSLSGGRARGQRRAYEIDLRGARPACGAVCGNGPWLAADVDGLLVPIGWRRGFGAAPAMMVPRRRGATNTTLAATQRHPCRSGMMTADCARSRSRPETWWRLAALKDHQNLAEFTISLTHSRARGADDRGRRRRNASYGVARDSHPVSQR